MKVVDVGMTALKYAEELLIKDATLLHPFPRKIQEDAYSCGAKSASMILAYYGIRISQKDVNRQIGLTEDGIDQYQLREFFAKHGLKATRINKPTVEKLKKKIDQGIPIIVELDGDHYAVVYGYAPGMVMVVDPAVSRSMKCAHSMKKFRSRWQRWALAVSRPGDSNGSSRQ